MRICRQGERRTEFFSDRRYGSVELSKAAALQRYSDLKKELPARLTTRETRSPRNQTGIVGVHIAITYDENGNSYPAYCASWKTESGKREKLSFAWKKFGQATAWELACIAREYKTRDRVRILRIYESLSSEQAPHRPHKPR